MEEPETERAKNWNGRASQNTCAGQARSLADALSDGILQSNKILQSMDGLLETLLYQNVTNYIIIMDPVTDDCTKFKH